MNFTLQRSLLAAGSLLIVALFIPASSVAKTMKARINIPGCVDLASLARWQDLVNAERWDAAIAFGNDAVHCILIRKGEKVDVISRSGIVAHIKVPWAPGQAKIPLYTRSDALR